jgi:hypothetical protein
MNFASLPEPLPEHIRVIRVEAQEGVRTNASSCFAHHWAHLPVPMEDDMPYAQARINLERHGHVCGALVHTFHEWFPEGWIEGLPSKGLQVVALDVPEHAALVGHFQVLFDREQAKEVQVLLC